MDFKVMHLRKKNAFSSSLNNAFLNGVLQSVGFV